MAVASAEVASPRPASSPKPPSRPSSFNWLTVVGAVVVAWFALGLLSDLVRATLKVAFFAVLAVGAYWWFSGRRPGSKKPG